MDSTRQSKFSRLIQKELADLFMKEGKHFFGTAFVTVTQVKVSPDLSVARVYLSVLKDKKAQDIVARLQDSMHEVRGKLGGRIRTQARRIPELKFFLDDTMDYVEKMNTLFKGLDIPPGGTAG
jgi:ribosome-binding factor A